MFMCTRTNCRVLIRLDYSWFSISTVAICNSVWYSWGPLCRIKELMAPNHQSNSKFCNSSWLRGSGVKMSGRCLWSSVINNTITEAIDYFWRDGHHLGIRTGVAGWKKNKNVLTSFSGLRASCPQQWTKTAWMLVWMSRTIYVYMVLTKVLWTTFLGHLFWIA